MKSGRAAGDIRKNLLIRLGADNKAGDDALDGILHQEKDIDIAQLKAFVWQCSFTDKYRLEVWRLLTGTTSCYNELKATIEKHHNEEAELLWRSLRCMSIQDSESSNPGPNDLVRMILLSNSELKDNIDFRSTEIVPIVSIVHVMRTSLDFSHWKEAFSLSRAAFRIFQRLFPVSVVESITTDVTAVMPHMNDDSLSPLPLSADHFSAVAIKTYAHSGGACLLRSKKAVQCIWDRLLGAGEQGVCLLRSVLLLYARHVHNKCSQLLNEPGTYSTHNLALHLVLPSEEEEIRLVKTACDSVRQEVRLKAGDGGRASTVVSHKSEGSS